MRYYHRVGPFTAFALELLGNNRGPKPEHRADARDLGRGVVGMLIAAVLIGAAVGFVAIFGVLTTVGVVLFTAIGVSILRSIRGRGGRGGAVQGENPPPPPTSQAAYSNRR